MNEHTKNDSCPCEAVRTLSELVKKHEETIDKHEQRLDKHDKRLFDGNTNFAVINTKLNFMLGVLGSIGVAVVGVLVKFVFNF